MSRELGVSQLGDAGDVGQQCGLSWERRTVRAWHCGHHPITWAPGLQEAHVALWGGVGGAASSSVLPAVVVWSDITMAAARERPWA